jgi:hypothetical protein
VDKSANASMSRPRESGVIALQYIVAASALSRVECGGAIAVTGTMCLRELRSMESWEGGPFRELLCLLVKVVEFGGGWERAAVARRACVRLRDFGVGVRVRESEVCSLRRWRRRQTRHSSRIRMPACRTLDYLMHAALKE